MTPAHPAPGLCSVRRPTGGKWPRAYEGSIHTGLVQAIPGHARGSWVTRA
jgi:hypothetical protein